MTELYLSSLTLRRAAGAAGTLAALLTEATGAEGDHRLVWSVFSADGDTTRDFLYRRKQPGRFYALSRRPPDDRHGLWTIETKTFAPKLRPGDRLRFSLRANPVVRRDGKRADVVMDRKKHPRPGDEAHSPAWLATLAGREWLEQRAAGSGFAVDPQEVAVTGYRQNRLSRRDARDIRFSSLDFDGILTVNEPDIFLETIARGLGPAKAFGCGLLLIRRAKIS